MPQVTELKKFLPLTALNGSGTFQSQGHREGQSGVVAQLGLVIEHRRSKGRSAPNLLWASSQ